MRPARVTVLRWLAPSLVAVCGGLVLFAAMAAGDNPMPAGPAVRVTADRSAYQIGEPVVVTIGNELQVAVYAPTPGGCSIVAISQQVAGGWSPVGTCSDPNVTPTAIPARTSLSRALWASQPPRVAEGPVVIGPVAPSATLADASSLPTAVPWKMGDPTREVREGAVAAPFSLVGGRLAVGTYRIEVTFAEGSPTGAPLTVYSDPFIVGA